MRRFSTLSNDALLERLDAIVSSHRRVTAELIAHLAEVDARRLHANKGFSSLFAYCVERLGFSEDEACRRIETARLARSFPVVWPLLEAGAVSLTVLGLVKHHLTPDNVDELLAGISGSSVQEAKEWLAARFPRPDVPSSIRKPTLPDPLPIASSTPSPATLTKAASMVSSPLPPAPTRARIEPLSSERFLVKFTASRAMKDKLAVARDLMRHANPNGGLSVVLEHALDLLIAELEKKKLGRALRPRSTGASNNDTVTRAARRTVVARDGWRCSFVGDDGRRCDSTAFVEFDHETPKGLGGTSHPDNLRLLCRAHNRLAAERVYGKNYVSHAILGAQNDGKKPMVVRDG